MRNLRLDSCGPFISAKPREFDVALQAYAGAKATKKLADTGERARRAGSNLGNAVRQMQQRIEAQEQEGQRFFVDDQIIPPSNFTKTLSVRVGDRWRPSAEAEWAHGAITFTHMIQALTTQCWPQSESRVPVSVRRICRTSFGANGSS